MKVLFLGGSKDGETMHVPDNETVVNVHVADPVQYSPTITRSTLVDFKVETYQRQRLRGESRTFEVFTPTGWTGDQLIQRLIERASNADM